MINQYDLCIFNAKPIVRSGVLAAAMIALTACGNDNNERFDLFRSSKSLPTDQIHLFVEANVHTHLGETAELDETHTTLQVELFGYDKAGYYYSVELDEADKLSAGVGSETFELTPDFRPSVNNPLSVLYYHDFENVVSIVPFDVTFDRDRDAELHTVSVTLPPYSDFGATPGTADPINFGDTITLDWVETEGFHYALMFDYVCEDGNQREYQMRVRLPNASQQTITSPFTFVPEDYFKPATGHSYTQCDLFTILKTYSDQTPDSPAPFAELNVSSTQQQKFEFNLMLPE